RMTDMTGISRRPSGDSLQTLLASLDFLSSARFLVGLVTLVCVLVTLEPFRDLRSAADAGAPDGRMAVTYLCFGMLATMTVLLAASENILALKTLWTPLHICLVLWMMVNIVVSENPGVSLQRFALTVSVTSLAIMMPLLLPTQKAFNQCLGIS